MGLYERSESWFAVAWIVAYVVVVGTLRANLGDSSLAGLAALAAFAALSAAFVRRSGTGEKYGLAVAPKNARRCLYFVPLVLLVLPNLVPFSPVAPGRGAIVSVLCMLLVGYVEEFVFRGLLFRAVQRENGLVPAVAVSAVTFGIGHLVNLLTGQVTLATLLQVCYAVAIGFAMVMVLLRCGSLWPCVACHGAIDVLSAVNVAVSSEPVAVAGSVFLVLVAGGYAWYLWKAGSGEGTA